MENRDLYSNYLAHHGIKGQKWGVRRFQNPDGTLTDEGRKRYLNSDGSLTKKGEKQYEKAKTELTKYGDKSFSDISALQYMLNTDMAGSVDDSVRDDFDKLFVYVRESAVKDLKTYKETETFIRELGKTPMSKLEDYPFLKLMVIDSPYYEDD